MSLHYQGDFNPCLPKLSERDPNLRTSAIDDLSQEDVQDPPVRSFLRRMAVDDADYYVREAAARALRRFGAPPLKEPASQPSVFSRRAFLLRWTLATVLGWALGLAIVIVFMFGSGQGPSSESDDSALVAFIIGWLIVLPSIGAFCASCSQWVVLRSYVRHSALWIPGSALGWMVGIIVVIPPIGAFCAAFLQWLSIRRSVPRSGWWVVTSGVGWTLAIAGTWVLLNLLLYSVFEPAYLAALAGVSLVPCVITAATMTNLLARAPSPPATLNAA
jgi:hypothetical protein